MFTAIAGRGRRLGRQPGVQPVRLDRASRWPASRSCCSSSRGCPARPRARRAAPDEAPGGGPAPQRACPAAPTRGRAAADRRRHGRDRGAAAQARHRLMRHDPTIDRNRLWARLDAAVAAHARRRCPPRSMVVDLDAFDANADDLVRRAGGKPVRVASKSLRVPALLERALAHDGLPRASWPTRCARRCGCTSTGISDDIVVAYPTVDRGALAGWSPRRRRPRRDHADGRRRRPTSTSSTRSAPRRRCRCGSPSTSTPACGWAASTSAPSAPRCTTPRTSSTLARTVVDRAGLPRWSGVMTYEGQVAGVPDDVPGQRARSLVVRRLKAASLRPARGAPRARSPTRWRERRRRWSSGTPAAPGSVEATAADPVGHRGRRRLRAAGARRSSTTTGRSRRARRRSSALPVVRRPSPQVATVHGGGLVASGPAGADRLPASRGRRRACT